MISTNVFVIVIVLTIVFFVIYVISFRATLHTSPGSDSKGNIEWDKWTKEQRKKNGIATWVSTVSGVVLLGLLAAFLVLFYISKIP